MNAAVLPRTAIRSMLPSDLKAVSRVEQAAYDFPWSYVIFRDCLLAGYYSLVLEVAGTVSGYGIMSIAAAEAHILNLCIDPELRRLGCGRRLLDVMLSKAQEAEVNKVFLEVRPTNSAALYLYEKAGFEQVGILPDYYQATHGRQNAVVLALNLLPSN